MLIDFFVVWCIVVGCVEKITRVLIDPLVAEVVLFKERYAALFCITFYIFQMVWKVCWCFFTLWWISWLNLCRLISSERLQHLDNVGSPSVFIPDQNELNDIVPSKTVSELLETLENGLFVVCAKIIGCFHSDKWWFPIYDCGRLMKALGIQYRCVHCHRTSFKVTTK
jgi:hypothetical protein